MFASHGARVVAERDAGGVAPRVCRPRLVDEFLPKIEEWVEESKGKVRADVAHGKLVAMGFTGSERSSRRSVAEIKLNLYQVPCVTHNRRSNLPTRTSQKTLSGPTILTGRTAGSRPRCGPEPQKTK